MKRQHKYFRNLRYKEKLEAKAHAHKTYWSHVVFYTKEPDPKYEREHSYRFWCYEKGLPVDKPLTGQSVYAYYYKPEVPYTILKVHTDHKYSRRRKELCTIANRRVRKRWKQYGEVYQHGEHKKVYDVAWELD